MRKFQTAKAIACRTLWHLVQEGEVKWDAIQSDAK
jgi:hypothetical protein